MADTQLLTGLPRSGKTTHCLAAYASALTASGGLVSAGKTLWLSPAREARRDVLERLTTQTDGVVFQPHVFTFDRFAERVLTENGHDGQAITSSARRLIVRHLIGEGRAQSRFSHFGKIARTEGFLEVVVSFIAELKRAEIWPDAFLSACRQRFGRTSPRDAELGGLYQRYQDLLNEKKWYDAEGRFWLARTVMQQQASGFWRNLSLIVVDGFSDFTRTQLEILELLAVSARQMLVTLPIEHPVSREELFAKPAGVQGHLQEIFSRHGPVRTVVCNFTPKSRPCGLQQVRDHLFENPRTVPRVAETNGVAIVAATGDRSEHSAVALRIKRLLAERVSPNEIVVGLRSAAASGQTWLRALSAAGIPVWCEAPPPWSRSPYVKALFSLMQLEAEDWPFERLRKILNSSLFRPSGNDIDWNAGDSPRRITRWLRRLSLHSVRLSTVRRIASRREANLPDDTAEDRSDLALADGVLTGLSDALEPLRRPHDLVGWADVIARLSSQWGLSSDRGSDRADAERLQGLLRAVAPIEAELLSVPKDSHSKRLDKGAHPSAAPERTLEEFLTLLRDIVQTEFADPTDRPAGRVRIVGAETLRHVQAAHVFLVDMTEDAFPSRRSDDCLYSETERLQLRRDGLELSHRELQQREEMLLFYQAVTRAASTLTLSYSLVNSQGHGVYLSPYVTAIAELFDPALKPPPEGNLDPLPDEDRILTPTDLRLTAVSRARRSQPGWWQRLLRETSTAATARNVLAAAETAVQRFHTRGFTAYEGRLSNPRHHAALAQRFESQRQFSATELESYATCPFRFWMSKVLDLAPLESPEAATDHLGRGSLVHDVLANLAGELSKDSSEVAERFRELVEQRMGQRIAETDLQQALLKVERELLRRWGEAFAGQNEAYNSKSKECRVAAPHTLKEIPFGDARDADVDSPQDRFPALVLGGGDAAIRLGGRIDRVDVAETDGRTVFTLIDYKTGRRPEFSTAKVESGQSLQLSLYLLAVMRLGIAGSDAVPLWMGYWTLKEEGFLPSGGGKGRAAWTPQEQSVFAELDALLTRVVPQLVGRIRSGEFVVENEDKDCTSHCPYHTVCRVNQIRPIADRREKHRLPLTESSHVR